MRAALAIARKDLRAIYRTRSALVLMLVAPLVVATILGAAFGGSSGFSLQAVKTVVVDLDRGAAVGASGSGQVPVAATVVKTLRSRQLSDLVDVTMEPSVRRGRQAVDAGDAVIAVVIPQGFSEAVTGIAARKASITFYQDPTQQVGPGIVKAIVGQVIEEINGARAAATAAGALKAMGSSGLPDMAKVTAAAERAAESFMVSSKTSGVSYVLKGPTLPGKGATMDPGITALVLAGQLVFFSLFGASTAARTILVEQQQGTLPRLFTTPASRGSILSGKLLMCFLVVLVQTVIILVVGALLFGIDWGAFLPVAVLAVIGPLVAAGLAMFIGSLSKTLAQEGAIGSGIFLVLALLGGNFTGAFSSGGVGQVLRRITPNGWLLEGWDTVMRGGSVSDIWLQILVVLAFSAFFFGVAVSVLRRRFA